MQTIGETTNKRDFVHSQWTDILFKSLSGKTNHNYTIDVQIGTKRIAAAEQAAQADNQDAKESPKKRRKQSNPTRISSNEDGANHGPAVTESSPSPRANQNQPDHVDRSSPLNLTKYENGTPTRSSDDVTKRSTSPCPRPTRIAPYLGTIDGRSSEPSGCAPFATGQQCGASTANPVAPSCPVQIFNREAFCDRCNKEFCNKYFLKTHKANKHGVFADHCPNDGGGTVHDPFDGNKTVWLPTAGETPSLFKSPVALVAQPPTNANAYATQMTAATATTAATANAATATTAATVNAVTAAAGNQMRAYCSVCHKEFCNKYFVKRHKAKIHGITDDGGDCRTAVDDAPLNFKTTVKVENDEHADTPVVVGAGAERRPDDRDDRDDENAYELGNETGAAVTDGANPCHGCRQTCDADAWLLSGAERYEDGAKSTGSGHSAEADGQQTAALSSFCRICNKELCNKYFMKTHMQRMHGISIRHGNHIGGVVCDVCNKELCSKYFLRVHKQNSHGIAAENGAAACPKPAWPENAQPAADEPAADGGHAYYRRYAEACDICFRRFRSPKWLAAHLLNDHGDDGRALWKRVRPSRRDVHADDACPADNGRERSALKQYRCSYCPFATSVLSFLFVHEKFHLAEDKTAAAAADDRCPPPSPEPRPQSRDVPEPVHEPFIMQSFFLENCSVSPSSDEPETAAGRSDSFHSSLVYLPVKEKLTSTVNVFFKLTPT